MYILIREAYYSGLMYTQLTVSGTIQLVISTRHIYTTQSKPPTITVTQLAVHHLAIVGTDEWQVVNSGTVTTHCDQHC